jgi:hypothetical protein
MLDNLTRVKQSKAVFQRSERHSERNPVKKPRKKAQKETEKETLVKPRNHQPDKHRLNTPQPHLNLISTSRLCPRAISDTTSPYLQSNHPPMIFPPSSSPLPFLST